MASPKLNRETLPSPSEGKLSKRQPRVAGDLSPTRLGELTVNANPHCRHCFGQGVLTRSPCPCALHRLFNRILSRCFNRNPENPQQMEYALNVFYLAQRVLSPDEWVIFTRYCLQGVFWRRLGTRGRFWRTVYRMKQKVAWAYLVR